MDDMIQTERIQQMERHLESAQEAVRQMEAALEGWAAAQTAFATLDEYYGSRQWRRDFDDDAAGRLPHDLRRGVLSEDGIWNVLEEWRRLKKLISVSAATS